MRGMTPSQARAFRDRWHAVAAAEAEEHRSASLLLRWEQMNALHRLGVALRLTPRSTGDQEKIVWERWAKLKELSE